jgi:hypothetical protein
MAKSRLAAFLRGEKKTFGQVDQAVAAATKKIPEKPKPTKKPAAKVDKIEVLPEYLEAK